jgi:hypothetical protein
MSDPVAHTRVSHRFVGKSERTGGGVRHDVVTTMTNGPDVDWPHCPKCGGRRFTGGNPEPGPHAPQLRERDGRWVKVDCAGDVVESPRNRNAA